MNLCSDLQFHMWLKAPSAGCMLLQPGSCSGCAQPSSALLSGRASTDDDVRAQPRQLLGRRSMHSCEQNCEQNCRVTGMFAAIWHCSCLIPRPYSSRARRTGEKIWDADQEAPGIPGLSHEGSRKIVKELDMWLMHTAELRHALIRPCPKAHSLRLRSGCSMHLAVLKLQHAPCRLTQRACLAPAGVSANHFQASDTVQVEHTLIRPCPKARSMRLRSGRSIPAWCMPMPEGNSSCSSLHTIDRAESRWT